jgi:hypothetical protein
MPKYTAPIGIHDTLNPKIWDGESLRPEVKKSLLRIAKEFYKFLKVSSPVQDVLLTGSQANYNYSRNSDIDLHLVFDFENIACDEPISELFDTKRKLWKEKHDIDIYGIPVEVYGEDSNNPSVSSAYSLIKDAWVRNPSDPVISYNKDRVEYLTALWIKLMEISIESKNLKICNIVQQLLADYRKMGLKVYGEFGVPNLVYKSLRNIGIIKHMSDTIIMLTDDDLSLD